MPQAVVPAALGFYGPLHWWSFQFVRLWRSSRRRPSSGCPLGACTIEQEQDLARVITGDGSPFIATHMQAKGSCGPVFVLFRQRHAPACSGSQSEGKL